MNIHDILKMHMGYWITIMQNMITDVLYVGGSKHQIYDSSMYYNLI